ncbi:CPBP family intramembrane metalloprotease [Sphingobacteriales bacterium CHB3]|nr:CPBP family intramembrane metalloprotease [Sphingobacteriales bacterium CHB3]
MNDITNTPGNSPFHSPPPTLFESVSSVFQRMPAWAFVSVSLIGIFFLYQIVGGTITFLLFGMDMADSNVTIVRLATMVGQVLFILIPTVILAKLRFPGRTNVFRFGDFHPGQLLLVLVAVFALQQLLQGYLMLQEAVPLELPPVVQQFVDQIKKLMEQMYRMLTSADSFPEFLFVVLVIAVTPAICEEILFRGLIQTTLEESGTHDGGGSRPQRGLTAAVIAGIVFGVYHLNPFTLIPLIVLGVYFGFVVYRTQNIVTSIAAHFFNNFLACVVVYLQLDENFIAISPDKFPDSETLLLNFALSSVVFVAATYYLVRITRRPA